MIGGLAIRPSLFSASPMIDFSRNHFELLGLPARFAVDGAALEHAYRDMQRSVHPDRYAGADDAQKRLALQASARANEAYRTLRDPLTRAEYLLALHGNDMGGETDARLSVDFLTRQLERREAAEEATRMHDAAALAALVDEVRCDVDALAADVAPLLDTTDAAAAARVREWRFLVKLADDLDALRAAADEA
jgi:molecular chaperone HscB